MTPTITTTTRSLFAAALALGACTTTPSPEVTRGSPIGAPPAPALQTRAQIDALDDQLGVRALTGDAACDVRITTVRYRTLGGRGEPTESTTAVMLPAGSDPRCTGARPIVVYSHGTNLDRQASLATAPFTDEGAELLGFYAAQGFIVIAPNYTGYTGSTLPYHPYLVAAAQADDVVDAIRASKASLAELGAMASDALFLTGYSEGGFVTMATQRAIEADDSLDLVVTASAPMSGPYQVEATLLDAVAAGNTDLAETSYGRLAYAILTVEAYQQAYGDIYATARDVYHPPFDTILPGLLPADDPAQAFAALGSPPPDMIDGGAGSPYVFEAGYLAAVQQDPQHGLRRAAARNNLLDWTPRAPIALCFGARDPEVPGWNSVHANAAFAARGVATSSNVLWNFEDAATIPVPELKQAFDAAIAGEGDAWKASYHAVILPPLCHALAAGWFAAR